MAIERLTEGAGGAMLATLSLVVSAVVVMLSEAGLLAAALGAALAVAAMVTSAVLVWRAFAVFLGVAIIVRPLLDLALGGNGGGGLSLTALFGLAVLAVTIVWLWVDRQHVGRRLTLPIGGSLLGLVTVMGLSTLGSATPLASVVLFLTVCAGWAVYLALEAMLDAGQLSPQRLVGFVAVAAVIPLTYPLLGLAGVTVTHDKDGVTALKSVFALSNNFAYFLLPVLLAAVAVAVQMTGWRRWLALTTAVVAGVELILSETRGAWLAAVVGIAVLCYSFSRRAALIAVTVLLVTALSVPSTRARLDELVPDPDKPRDVSSFAWRVEQWQRLLPMTAESPLLGVGPGEAERVTSKAPHNDYVRALTETGGLGLIAFVWFMLAACLTGRRARLRVRAVTMAGPDPVHLPLFAAVIPACAAYTVAVAVGALGENLIDNLTFWWAAAPCLALLSWASTASEDQLRTQLQPTRPVPDQQRQRQGLVP